MPPEHLTSCDFCLRSRFFSDYAHLPTPRFQHSRILSAFAVPFDEGSQVLFKSAKREETQSDKNPGGRVTRHNSYICDAGSNHWTGTVNLGTGRDMFFSRWLRKFAST